MSTVAFGELKDTQSAVADRTLLIVYAIRVSVHSEHNKRYVFNIV